MADRRSLALELATIAGFCAFLFYFGLGAFGLVGADEPRYAQIAREMLERRDLVTPTLWGHPWLEKPPLYYWRAMEGYYFFGVKEWVARAPAASAATAMIFVVYFFARRFRPGAQLNAALITAACAGVIGFARGAGMDMLLTSAFTVGMLGWWAWHETGRKLWLVAFYVFMAFGTLAKGPVAPCLAALVIVVYAAVRRDSKIVWRTLWMPGIVLFLGLALPWYVAVQRANPQFFREFILQHNLERFASNRYHHKQPFWYYVPVMLLALVPWTALSLAALADALRNWRARLRAAEAAVALPMFLLIWLAVILVLFSISQSKLPGYILPAVPAWTLLTADWLRERQRLGWPLLLAQGLISGALAAFALLFPNLLAHPHNVPSSAKLLAGGVGAVICFATVGTLWRQPARMLRFVVLVPVIIGLGFLLRAGAPVIDSYLSARPIARSIAEMERCQAQVAVYRVSREVEYDLGFYRNHAIPRYERGETPAGDHLVIVPEQYEDELLKLVRPRRASRLGSYPAQKLEYFWVSPPMAHEHQ